jgi:hypothetical protein
MGHKLDVGAVGARRRTYWPRMDEQAWRDLFARLDASGLSIEEFCSRHDRCRSSFVRWRVWPRRSSRLAVSRRRSRATRRSRSLGLHRRIAADAGLGFGRSPTLYLARILSTVPTARRKHG